jgi:PAS domain-containing protein
MACLSEKELSSRTGPALLRADGSKLFVYYTAAANYLPGRHVVILCDATEQVHAQASLEESQQRFRQMAENIGEIFWMMDAANKEVLYVKPSPGVLWTVS